MPRDVIQRLTQAFGKLPQVLAVVLGGSRAAATSDVASDYDLYVYTVLEKPCKCVDSGFSIVVGDFCYFVVSSPHLSKR